MADMKISEMTSAAQVNETDNVELSQGSSGSFSSVKATILAIANKIVSGINFTSALQTTNKTITGAINEVAQGGGGGSSTLSGLSDVDIDTLTLDDGQGLVYDETEGKWVNGSASGGGHTIVDNSGTSLAQEPKLKLNGMYVHDDSANQTTVGEYYREMTTAQYNQLSATEKQGMIRLTDNNYVCDGTEVKYSNGVSVKNKIDGLVYTGDLNDLTETGVYGHSVTASSNAPSDVAVGTLLNISVITTSLGITTQIAYYGNMRIYVRRKVYDAWNDWVKLASSWTYLGEKTGTAEHSLPTGWKELLLQVNVNSGNLVTYHIYNVQTDNYTNTSLGNYGTSYAVGQISRTKAKISTVNWAGSDVTSSAKLYAYYR